MVVLVPPVEIAPADLLAVFDQDVGAGVGRGFLSEHRLHQGRALIGADEGIDHAEQVKGQRPVAARPSRYVNPELLVRHQRDQLDRGVHELRDALMQLFDRELRAAILLQADEVDDLLGVLAEDELVAARQHRDRARAELLQLREA